MSLLQRAGLPHALAPVPQLYYLRRAEPSTIALFHLQSLHLFPLR